MAVSAEKAAATIWGVGWRIAAILFGATFVIGMLNACGAGKPDDITVPNTSVNANTSTPEVQPNSTNLCVNSTISVGETEMAVLDTIGTVPQLMYVMGETGLPAGDELTANVQAAVKVYMAHTDLPIAAESQIKVCVNNEGFITSVNDVPVPTS